MKSWILLGFCLTAVSCNNIPHGNPIPNVALEGVVLPFPAAPGLPSGGAFKINLDAASALEATTQGAPCPGTSCTFTVEGVPYTEAQSGVSAQVRPQDSNWLSTSSDVFLSAEPNEIGPHAILGLQPPYALPASLVQQLTQTLGKNLSPNAALIVGVLRAGPTVQSVQGLTVTDSSSFNVFYFTADGAELQPAASPSGVFAVVTPGTPDIWGTGHTLTTTVNSIAATGVVTLIQHTTAAVVIQLP